MNLEDHSVFAALQAQLRQRWNNMHDELGAPMDVVVVPSLSLDGVEHAHIDGLLHYEERMLFTLNLLKYPGTRLMYVSSEPIDADFINYMLSLVHDASKDDMRRRLRLLCVFDEAKRPLTEKLLGQPRLIEEVRAWADPDKAYLTTFAVTDAEEELAVQLGIPLYGCDTSLRWIGTKSGSRSTFKMANVSVAPGAENLMTIEDAVHAIADLIEAEPTLDAVVLKHNSGFSGMGNAILDLTSIDGLQDQDLTRSHREQIIADAVAFAKLADTESSWESYRADFETYGGVVEAFVSAKQVRTPSTQLRISPAGELALISTHDQLVTGPFGQVYAGCLFPAANDYRIEMQREALKIGKVLKDQGVVGRFAIDFMALETETGRWELVAIEINLRLGGTTHPMMLMQMLSDGAYDPRRGLYFNSQGKQRSYMATDNLEQQQYKGLTFQSLFDIVDRHGIHYNESTGTGLILHLTGALTEHGKLGMTAIAKDRAAAQRLFAHAHAILDSETGAR